MYLMNVSPVAATHTEWRTRGPPRGYSLPLCFNDSDIQLSPNSSPVTDKVQMIIESLRSTQSSLDMGDEIEGNVLSGQEVHPQVCKVAMAPFVGPKAKTKGPTENQQADISSPINYESHYSDSDDSVDRDIEEAILEYLKEKDDHKRKAEPSTNFLPSSKIPRKNPPIPEISKQHSDSNKVLIASNQFPKSVKVESPTTPAIIPMKKLMKIKVPFKENPVKKMDTNPGTTAKIIFAKEQMKSSSKTSTLFHKVKCPITVKVEEDSPDSSSDDGIEEAIQRYQLEKKEKQNTRETCTSPLTFKEESDSTSDDGIEEAIRCYQLEQLKEKTVVKPFLQKQKPIIKSPIYPIESTSAENIKKHKSRKKKKRTEKEVKSVLPPPSSVCLLKNIQGSPKGNGLLPSKVETFSEQHTPATPKVNTTAELMCAEAILDISKAVMPEAFNPNVGLSSCTLTPSSLLPSNCPDGGSDDSSIDSEDGIEQEIRKFLEQKAQMHKQPPSSGTITTDLGSMKELDKVKTKPGATQKKALRLSLTQKRRHKEEACNVSKNSVMDDKNIIVALTSLPEQGRGSSPMVSSQRCDTPPLAGLQITEQSGDKSSSLDSDEDLDTAIKDLLKTKKKLKKKTRDIKLKSRKCLKDAEPLLWNALQATELKPDPISKHGHLKKLQKSDMREKSKLSKKSNKRQEHITQAGETDTLKGTGSQVTPSLLNAQTVVQIKEDSSSVDSDDSIEQEIRKFLAEKAKVSTTEKTKDGDVPSNGNVDSCAPLPDKHTALENQLAEIPRKCITPLPGQSLMSSPENKPFQDREAFPTTQIALSDNSSSTPTVSAQSCISSAFSNSPGLLEPADGAGAAKTEKRKPSTGSSDVQEVTSETVKAQPLMSPGIVQSRSDSVKWRQSLGLTTTETRRMCLSRTPFHITSSKVSKTASTTPYERVDISPKPRTPITLWSSARSSRSVTPISAETPVNTMSHSSFYKALSARQHPGRSLTPGGHRAQDPIAGQAESMVHMSKDQSVFVELASDRTNHVQVQSREMNEGKERRDWPSEKKREGERIETEDEEIQIGRAEEDFIDETDCEADKMTAPEKKQGVSTLCLSSAIDHGITLRPCIALTTEERNVKFNRRYMAVNCKKTKTAQDIKRKLQFLSYGGV
ncbi:protein phosphatase 1 regulatory subunit 26 [Diretmus argenteus]